MIFGGYGRKAKRRGEVIYFCVPCATTTVFGLVETYRYGQVYGVRVAKIKTRRLMVCARCQDGLELSAAQWKHALSVSADLEREASALTEDRVDDFVLRLAAGVYPGAVPTLRELLAGPLEQVGAPSTSDATASTDAFKSCPDCAEEIRTAARKCRYCGLTFD